MLGPSELRDTRPGLAALALPKSSKVRSILEVCDENLRAERAVAEELLFRRGGL